MNIKTTLIAAGAVIAASFAAIPSANAGNVTIQLGFGDGGYHQGYNQVHSRRFVPERRIHRILRHNGFRNANVWRRGPVYIARAEDRRGRDYQIRLSAFDGNIIAVNRLNRRPGRWH